VGVDRSSCIQSCLKVLDEFFGYLCGWSSEIGYIGISTEKVDLGLLKVLVRLVAVDMIE